MLSPLPGLSFGRGHLPDTALWVPANRPVSLQSSEDLALVCLQVLADLRNVQDNYYPTQERPAQPSHIWKEAATQGRAKERSPAAAQASGRFNPSSQPCVLVNWGRHSSGISLRVRGIQCTGRVRSLLQEKRISQTEAKYNFIFPSPNENEVLQRLDRE